MDKQTLLKQFYISQIAKLIELCSDISILDLVYRILDDAIKGKMN